MVCFFNDTATTEFYTYWHTLALHYALPLWPRVGERAPREHLDPHRVEKSLIGAVNAERDMARATRHLHVGHRIVAVRHRDVGAADRDHAGNAAHLLHQREIGRAHV